jgi:predicted ATP-dependent serine protease
MYQTTPLEQVLRQLRHRYGHEIIHLASQLHVGRTTLSTSILEVDALLQGGILIGHWNEFVGTPSSGATSLLHHTTAHLQQQGYEVVYIDFEQVFDPLTATAIGINIEKLMVVHPPEIKQAMELVRHIALSKIPCLVVVDFGTLALSHQLRSFYFPLQQSICCVLVGTTQPTALAQLQISLNPLTWIQAGKDIIGYQVQANLLKHPTLPPRETTFVLRLEREQGRA